MKKKYITEIRLDAKLSRSVGCGYLHANGVSSKDYGFPENKNTYRTIEATLTE